MLLDATVDFMMMDQTMCNKVSYFPIHPSMQLHPTGSHCNYTTCGAGGTFEVLVKRHKRDGGMIK